MPLLRRWPGLLAVAAATVAFQLPFFDRWFSPMDEGHILLFADMVGRGGMLYRDASIYPLPGAFYALALAFELFEPSVRLARWIVVFEFAAFVALAYALVLRLVSTGWGLAFVGLLWLYRIWAFPHWHMYSYSTTALLVLLCSAVALLRYLEGRDARWLLLSGFLFGLGVFCKQDYGGATLLALSFTLVVDARSARAAGSRSALASLGLFIAPAAIVGAMAGLHFWLQGQLGLVVRLTALTHVIGMASYEYPTFPPLLPLFEQIPALRDGSKIMALMPSILPTVDYAAFFSSWFYEETALYETALKLFIYAPSALLALGAVRLWRRRGRLHAAQSRSRYLAELLLFAIAVGLMLVITLVKPQDYIHLAVLYWPLIGLGVVYLADLAARGRGHALVLAAIVLIPVLLLTAYTGRLAWRLRTTHDTPLASPRGGIYVLPAEAELLDDVVAYIHASSGPDEPVAAMPYLPIVQFLADRRGPHASSYIVWPFAEYPDRDERIVEAMERTGTPIVIYNFNQFLEFPRVSEYAPVLFDYLVERFEMDRVFNYDYNGHKVAALVRSQGPESGRPLLAEHDPRSTLWIEAKDGSRVPLAAEDRPDHLAFQRWPFRPVLALRPSTDGARTVLSVPLSVSPAAVLRTAVGVHPEKWFAFPPSWVEYRIGVVDGDRRAEIFRRRLDPHKRFDERGWFEVELPLDAWAGRRVEIELSTETERERERDLRMGGWSEPRIVAAGDAS